MDPLEEAIRKLRELSVEERAEIAREIIRGAAKPEGRRQTKGM